MRKTIIVLAFTALLAVTASPVFAGQYLVKSKGGAIGRAEPADAAETLEWVLTSFDALIKLEADKKIVAGGIPAGSRGWVFVVEASSPDEVDKLIRDLSIWSAYEWKVIPLQSFSERAKMERANLKKLKK